MSVLITGSGGLLGSKLAEILSERGYIIYSGYYSNKPLRGIPINLDVSSEESVREAFKISRPEVVVHAAALTNVDKCEIDKELAWNTNVVGTRNIAKASEEYNALLIYISTDYIFKGDKGMYKEEDKPEPINYYGLTKLKGEEEVKSLVSNYLIARASVIYGAMPASGKTNFALWIIENLKRGEKIKVVVDQWNSPTLNTSLAEMISEAIERKITGTYHLAGATRISRYDFAKQLAKTFDLREDLIMPVSSDEISWTARRPKDSSLDVSKALKTFHNKPLNIKDAMEKLREEIDGKAGPIL
ncbi:dTDP-4-dehydrorhamnose reductase [Candidatus Bathyarchaeota archaeon]|nr:dTDP-4-dehydrorhamnose reductase [Candidatus Bathyarchaeota archaeon]